MFFFALATFFLAPYQNTALAKRSRRAISKPVTSESGLKIPKWGIAIDASYNSDLDDFIPGYKIVHVVLSNNRPDTIVMSPTKDRWTITDSAGKKHTAYNHVRHFNKQLWKKLKPELKKKLDYPSLVKSGHLTTLDLFFPKDVDLFQFREIAWASSFFAKKFDVFTNYEKSLSQADDKQTPLTSPNALSLDEIYNKSKEEILGNKKQVDPRHQTEPPVQEDKNEGPKLNFDPSFDDAIIIR